MELNTWNIQIEDNIFNELSDYIMNTDNLKVNLL